MESLDLDADIGLDGQGGFDQLDPSSVRSAPLMPDGKLDKWLNSRYLSSPGLQWQRVMRWPGLKSRRNTQS